MTIKQCLGDSGYSDKKGYANKRKKKTNFIIKGPPAYIEFYRLCTCMQRNKITYQYILKYNTIQLQTFVEAHMRFNRPKNKQTEAKC